jgi:hypothetical protein
LGKLQLLVASSILLASCTATSLEAAVQSAGLTPDAIVRLDFDVAVAARASGGSVDVVQFRETEDGWSSTVLATGSSAREHGSVNVFGYDGDTPSEWNTFAFGAAPAGAARVEIDYEGATGGQVTDGVWVVAIPAKAVSPSQLEWRFVDPLDRVIANGVGLYEIGS